MGTVSSKIGVVYRPEYRRIRDERNPFALRNQHIGF